MRIYPTTTFNYQYLDENNQIQNLNYHVVSFHEYLYDQDIDLFYIENASIISVQQTIELDKAALEYAYLGYLDNPKELTLLFPRDPSKASWIFNVQDIRFNYKSNIPNWGDEDNV